MRSLVALFLSAAVAVCLATTATSAASAQRHHNVIRLQKALRDSGPRSNWLLRNAPEFVAERAKANNKRTHHHDGGSNIPIEGSVWPTSIFWTTVQVGTPLKSFAVAIDSGSPRLFLSGKNCSGCVTTFPNRPYDPSASSSSAVVPNKTFDYTYETCDPSKPLEPCSILGPYYTDVVSLAGFGPAPILLGKIEQQTSNFYQFHTIDGIMGMVSSHNPDPGNVFQALCIRGGLCRPVWGICMKEGLLSNGTMTIGGVDDRLAEGPITYVPSTNQTAWHEVYVHNFSIGGAVGATIKTSQIAILDTGTNDLLIPTEVFHKTKAHMCSDSSLKHCEAFFSGNNTACFALSEAEVDAYPPLTFDLDKGLKLHMSSRDYLLKGSPAAASRDQYCFGISDGGGYFIFGDTIMQNYYLVFEEQRVGWGKVNKANCGSV